MAVDAAGFNRQISVPCIPCCARAISVFFGRMQSFDVCPGFCASIPPQVTGRLQVKVCRISQALSAGDMPFQLVLAGRVRTECRASSPTARVHRQMPQCRCSSAQCIMFCLFRSSCRRLGEILANCPSALGMVFDTYMSAAPLRNLASYCDQLGKASAI